MNTSLPTYGDGLPIDYHNIVRDHDYYDLINEQFVLNENGTIGTVATDPAFRSFFALVSRIGFILIQVGSIPVENVYTIVLYNIIEISLVLLSYGLIGNWLAFGPETAGGWISYGGWDENFTFKFWNLDEAVIGLCASLVATAQMSTFLVGRINLAGGMILSVFYCAIFQPFLMHWIWHERGWMRHSVFLDRHVSVKDHAGDLVLHLPSAIFGAIGAVFLGRRVVKLRDIDRLSFGTENGVNSVIGYLLIILNYVVFALPTPMYEKIHSQDNYSAIITTNSLLATAAGIIIITILQFSIFRGIKRYKRLIRCVQGGMAGVISIAAAVDLYTPLVTLLLSMGSTVFFFFFAELLHNTALEDSCSFISSHMICGFIGIMLCPLLAHKENLGNTVKIQTRGVHMLWQLICTVTVIGLSIIVALFIFLLLKILRGLRNDFEVLNHKRATVIRDASTKRAPLEKLFVVNDSTDHVEPGFREKYFDTGPSRKAAEKVNPNNVFLSDGDKTSTVVALEQEKPDYNKKFDATVMHFEAGDMLPKSNIVWRRCGSGDYFDPYLHKPSSDHKEPAKGYSKNHCTSWKGYNEV